MIVGGSDRGWGARGGKRFAIDRLVWTGEVPFEVREMRAQPNGFELTFTKPVDPKTAGDVGSYSIGTYTYIMQSSYGSPEVDHSKPTITKANVADDKKSVRLVIDGLKIGHVHELHLNGVKSADGEPVLHKEAYYTLNRLPED